MPITQDIAILKWSLKNRFLLNIPETKRDTTMVPLTLEQHLYNRSLVLCLCFGASSKEGGCGPCSSYERHANHCVN